MGDDLTWFRELRGHRRAKTVKGLTHSCPLLLEGCGGVWQRINSPVSYMHLKAATGGSQQTETEVLVAARVIPGDMGGDSVC